MVCLVDRRHVIRHATDRHVILVLGNYVIGMVVGLNVIRGDMIRLRLNRLRDLRHVILVMVDLVQRLLIDLQNRIGQFASYYTGSDTWTLQ